MDKGNCESCMRWMLELDAFSFTDDEGSCFAVQMGQRRPQPCQYVTWISGITALAMNGRRVVLQYVLWNTSPHIALDGKARHIVASCCQSSSKAIRLS